MFPKGEVTNREHRRHKLLCIDNHGSSTYLTFLLVRHGYHVDTVSFLCDALDLIRSSAFDLFLVNDEVARDSGKEFLRRLGEAAGRTPVIFYSNVIYPYCPRSADQSGSTPETPVPVTELGVVISRVLAEASTPAMARINAA